MKTWFKSTLVLLTLLVSFSSTASIITLPDSGVLSDSVIGDSAWIAEDTFGDGLDFVVFDISTPSFVSINIDSLIDMGISLYSGTITNDFGFPFNNNSDFTDLFSDLVFVAGTDAFVPGNGNSLDDIDLLAGSYTLAVGGNEGLFDTFTEYVYNLEVNIQEVSEPPLLFMIFFAVAGVLAVRKQQ